MLVDCLCHIRTVWKSGINCTDFTDKIDMEKLNLQEQIHEDSKEQR